MTRRISYHGPILISHSPPVLHDIRGTLATAAQLHLLAAHLALVLPLTMSPPQGLSRGQKVKFAFSSPANFHTAITLDSAAGKLINEDLVPSPPARWTWNAWSYLAYWWSEAWAVSTWSIGSSMVTLGVSHTVEMGHQNALLRWCSAPGRADGPDVGRRCPSRCPVCQYLYVLTIATP